MIKTKNLFLMVILFTAVSCGPGNDGGEASIEIVKKYVSAVEAHDYDTMGFLLAEQYVGLGPSINDTINKSQAVENWKNQASELYESIIYEESRFIAVQGKTSEYEGNWVANWAVVKIDYKEDKGSARLFANSIYQLENDKIVRSFTFYNEADVLEQLGYIFIHPTDLY